MIRGEPDYRRHKPQQYPAIPAGAEASVVAALAASMLPRNLALKFLQLLGELANFNPKCGVVGLQAADAVVVVGERVGGWGVGTGGGVVRVVVFASVVERWVAGDVDAAGVGEGVYRLSERLRVCAA